MRVFISHSSQDKEPVTALAAALRDRGIDAWLDLWELRSGDDLVARINQALDQADAGLIVFSAAAAASRWPDRRSGAARSAFRDVAARR